MTIHAELHSKILRLHFVEQWGVNTIARQLHIHHSVVERVLSQVGVPQAERTESRSIRDPYNDFIVETLNKYPELTATRKSGKNIDVDAYRISQDLQLLIDDCKYWIKHDTYAPDEIAARFHHRLVTIHPYANGNGRHARLAADLLLVSLRQKRFSWGRGSLLDAGQTRANYIEALRAADHHGYASLQAFVRS